MIYANFLVCDSVICVTLLQQRHKINAVNQVIMTGDKTALNKCNLVDGKYPVSVSSSELSRIKESSSKQFCITTFH